MARRGLLSSSKFFAIGEGVGALVPVATWSTGEGKWLLFGDGILVKKGLGLSCFEGVRCVS